MPEWIVPIRPEREVLEGHVCVVSDNLIERIVPRQSLGDVEGSADWIDLPGHVLIPGLINAHTHAAMNLMRGIADDLPLQTWLEEYIWPIEGQWVSPEFVADGTRLAIAEMIRGGTTCFNDSYFFPNVAARVAHETGIRASIGMPVLEFPTPWASNADEYLSKAEMTIESLSDFSRVTTTLAPHAPYTVSDASFTRIRSLAEHLSQKVHLHLHETAKEVADAIAADGYRPFSRLQRLGLMNESLMAVHMTQLNDDEIDAAAIAGISVLHCPQSNQKLASGFCPAEALRAAGVNVAIGTDGAASNNDLDMFDEMRSTALTGKAVARDARAVPAHWTLEAATLGGARALGLDDQLGSIEAGKSADLAAIDLRNLATQPVYDVISQLVFAVSREQVSNVWVAGQRLLEDKRLTTIDEAAMLDLAADWQKRISNAHDSR